jgi:hypothetical protein
VGSWCGGILAGGALPGFLVRWVSVGLARAVVLERRWATGVVIARRLGVEVDCVATISPKLLNPLELGVGAVLLKGSKVGEFGFGTASDGGR